MYIYVYICIVAIKPMIQEGQLRKDDEITCSKLYNWLRLVLGFQSRHIRLKRYYLPTVLHKTQVWSTYYAPALGTERWFKIRPLPPRSSQRSGGIESGQSSPCDAGRECRRECCGRRFPLTLFRIVCTWWSYKANRLLEGFSIVFSIRYHAAVSLIACLWGTWSRVDCELVPLADSHTSGAQRLWAGTALPSKSLQKSQVGQISNHEVSGLLERETWAECCGKRGGTPHHAVSKEGITEDNQLMKPGELTQV